MHGLQSLFSPGAPQFPLTLEWHLADQLRLVTVVRQTLRMAQRVDEKNFATSRGLGFRQPCITVAAAGTGTVLADKLPRRRRTYAAGLSPRATVRSGSAALAILRIWSPIRSLVTVLWRPELAPSN